MDFLTSCTYVEIDGEQLTSLALRHRSEHEIPEHLEQFDRPLPDLQKSGEDQAWSPSVALPSRRTACHILCFSCRQSNTLADLQGHSSTQCGKAQVRRTSRKHDKARAHDLHLRGFSAIHADVEFARYCFDLSSRNLDSSSQR